MQHSRCTVLSAFLVLLLLATTGFAQDVTVANLDRCDQVTTTLGPAQVLRTNPPQYKVTATLTNQGASAVEPPFYVSIEGLPPGVVSVGHDIVSTEGIPLYVCEDPLGPGETKDLVVCLQLLGRARIAFSMVCYREGAPPPPDSPPPPPTVIRPPSPTCDASTQVAGTSQPNATICIVAPGGNVQTTADGNGSFAATVQLASNKLNKIFVSAKNAFGQSSQVPVEVVQDSQPPSLFVDLPANNSTIVTPSNAALVPVTVVGRVSDILSGFLGLQVKVTSNADNVPRNAIVNIGIGTNGTFEAQGVPLAIGANQLTAMATDAVGKVRTVVVNVTRQVPPPNSPTMTIISGNNQVAQIGTDLPNPLVVELKQGNGNPFVGKIVTFQITRSGGFLGTSLPVGGSARNLQVTTGANGRAQVFMKLGMDAGCGNNRVTVTSASVQGTVIFCASATPAPPNSILIGGGNNQVGGSPAPEKLKVWVNDGCNGVASVPVTYNVVLGNGKVNGLNTVTVLSGPTGHAEVEFEFGDPGPQEIVANFPGNPGNPVVFTLFALEHNEGDPTTFSGQVLDNSTQPIGGACVDLQVDGQLFSTLSEADGTFEFSGIPSGPADLFVDGSVATQLAGMTIPQGSFPALHYEPVLVANAANVLGGGPVLLPPLNPNNARVYDGTMDVELTVEEIEGLKMTITAGSMRRADGTVPNPGEPAIVSLNQVHFDEVPMPMPDGTAPAFAWTLQPGGATFDPPVSIEYPNMTGLPPGSAAYFLSFNHDTGEFEIVATGSVSEDGAFIRTDPGSGISVAGWGCQCPPYPPTATCRNCQVRITGPTIVCKDQNATFTATGSPGGGIYAWSGGGTPATGSGASFTTKWSTAGTQTVSVTYTVFLPPLIDPCIVTATHEVCVVDVDLDVADDDLKLAVPLEDNTLTAMVDPGGKTVTNYKFEIRRKAEATWHTLQNGPMDTFMGKARIAGDFKVRVTATVDGVDCMSPEKDVKVRFPTIGEQIANATVSTKAEDAWTATKNATTTTTRREQGFVIVINTTGNGSYEFTNDTVAAPVKNNEGAVWDTAPGSRPADDPASPTPITNGAKYSVGWFHTHTSMEHRGTGPDAIPAGSTRGVGPSGGDFGYAAHAAINMPGLAYDYVESPAGSGSIPVGHPTNSAAQIYQITPPDPRPLNTTP